ncbi:MAG: universal stress protein [Gammaproteobacteria bacterium]|nr:universal stress protein [Gammaproteobacteria bacterium]
MNILAGIDFSESAQKIIDQTVMLAKALNAKIWLIHVAEPDPAFVGYEADPEVMRDVVAKKYHEEHRDLQAIASALRGDGLDCVALLVQGATVATLLREAAHLPAALIVIGSHGKGALKRLLIGSTSEGILHASEIPVHIVPTR